MSTIGELAVAMVAAETAHPGIRITIGLRPFPAIRAAGEPATLLLLLTAEGIHKGRSVCSERTFWIEELDCPPVSVVIENIRKMAAEVQRCFDRYDADQKENT